MVEPIAEHPEASDREVETFQNLLDVKEKIIDGIQHSKVK